MKQQKTVLSCDSDFHVIHKNTFVALPFSDCLKKLLFSTDEIIANVISLHLYLQEQKDQEENILFLSRFHLDLFGQTIALRHHITVLCGVIPASASQTGNTDYWRMSDVSNIPQSFMDIAIKADMLTALYEHLLPVSAVQSDDARSWFLLAGHMSVLNTSYERLKRGRL